MKRLYFYFSILSFVLLHSCVSSKKFDAMQRQSQTRYDSLYAKSESDLKACKDANADLSGQKSALQGQARIVILPQLDQFFKLLERKQ